MLAAWNLVFSVCCHSEQPKQNTDMTEYGNISDLSIGQELAVVMMN